MPEATTDRPGRNDPCHCGSGKKYKRCCLTKEQVAEREAYAKAKAEAEAEAEAPTPEVGEPHATDVAKPPRPTDQPWKHGTQNRQPFQRLVMPRRRGD